MEMENRLARIEEKVSKIEEWIEEEQGILDTLAVVLLKTASSGDPNLLEVLENLQDKAGCITSTPLEAPQEPPTLTQLLRMLSDPEVRRGLYIALTLMKRLGACTGKG